MNKKIILISIFFAFLIALIPLRADWSLNKSLEDGLVSIRPFSITYHLNYSSADYCKDDQYLWVSSGYWGTKWVNTSHWETRYENVWVSSRYWESYWVDTSHWTWVSSGYWQSYWVNTSHWETRSYSVWVSSGYWARRWVSTSHWETRYRTVREAYRVWVTSGYWRYTRYGRYWVSTSHWETRYRYVRQSYRVWVSSGYWQSYWVNTSHWETRSYSVWVSSGYWARRWVDTSHWVWVSSGYTAYRWVNTSHWETRSYSVWVSSGYFKYTWVDTSHWKNCGKRICTTATYYCKGSERRYTFSCSGGCSGTDCRETSYYDRLKTDCGSRTCTPYTYYCVGDKVYKKTTCSGGCSGGDCRVSNTYTYFVEDCPYGCSEGECKEPGGCLTHAQCPDGCWYCAFFKCRPTAGTGINSLCGKSVSGNYCYEQKGVYLGCVGNETCLGTIWCSRLTLVAWCGYKVEPGTTHDCGPRTCDTTYYCDGSKLYWKMICSGGCLGGFCQEDSTYKVYVTDCGLRTYTDTYYCSGNKVYISRVYSGGCSGTSCQSDTTYAPLDGRPEDCGTSKYEYRISGDWQQRSYVERGCKDGSCYTKYGPWVNYLQDCGHTCLNHGTASVAWPDCSCTNRSPASGYEKIGTWNTYDCGNNCTGYRSTGLQDCGHTCVSHGTASHVWPDCSCTNRSPASGYERIGTWNSSDCSDCTGYKKTGCPCTGWVNGSCGGGSCSATERQHTRTCTPSGCDIESKCVSDSACVTPTPTLSLTANPSSIIKGQFSTLSWSSTYTTSRTWTGGMSGSELPSGSKGVNPSVTTTYSMSATGPGGSVSRSITVTVSIPIPNQSPSATNLKVVQPDYCVSGPAGIFSWTFTDPDSGDTQSAYQIQVDKNSNFNSPEDDSGKVTSSSNSYATILGKLKYKTTYYWRVKVWDNHDAESIWVSGPNFTTPEHAYPSIDFKWSPLAPSINEEVLFTDQSTVYGGASKTSWSWTFQNGSPATSSQQNPTVKFFSTGEKLITLRVTDSDGYSCSRSKTLSAEFPLPKWKEIAPF